MPPGGAILKDADLNGCCLKLGSVASPLTSAVGGRGGVGKLCCAEQLKD